MNDAPVPSTANPFKAMRTVGVVAANSVDYVRQMLENLDGGLVSVPLDSPQDRDRLERTCTTEIQEPAPSAGWIDRPFHSRGGDDPAQISFTSGTQGSPKAVLLSHGNLHDVVVRVTHGCAASSFNEARRREDILTASDLFLKLDTQGFDQSRRLLQWCLSDCAHDG